MPNNAHNQTESHYYAEHGSLARGTYYQLENVDSRTKMVVRLRGSRDFLRELPGEELAGIPVLIQSLSVCLQMDIDDIEVIDIESQTRYRTSLETLRLLGTSYNLNGLSFLVLPVMDWDHESGTP